MSEVVIKECRVYDVDTIIGVLNKGIGLLGGWSRFVKSGDNVLLKVNLIGPKDSSSAAITHCTFVQSLTKILRQRGCQVWIGDSSGGAIAGIAPTTQSFSVSGLSSMAAEEGARIMNFDKEGAVPINAVSGIVGQMYLAKPLFEADVVINLPKLKTHSAAMYTGAVKNMFGAIPGLAKANYHKLAPNPLDFGEIIADIHDACNISLHIMDGIVAMQGEGPTAGEPYPSGKILFSTDPLALDSVACNMLGLAIKDVPILLTAGLRNIGEAVLENIDVLGDYAKVPYLPKFKLPKRLGKRQSNYKYKLLGRLIDFMKTRPVIDLDVCQECNMCVESCPVSAIDEQSKQINYEECIECMCCHELCMQQAVSLKRQNILASVLMDLFGKKYS